jgi:fumarate hydratase class II
MLPVMAYNLLQSIDILAAACHTLRHRCIEGITANTAQCEVMVEHSLALGTALVPVLGYDATAALTREALHTGKTIRETARACRLLPEAELAKVLNTRKMTERGF